MFRLDVSSPSAEDLTRILANTTGNKQVSMTAQITADELHQLQILVREVLCGSHLTRFVAELVVATHPENSANDDATKRFVRYGASARAGQAILLGAKARALLAGHANPTLPFDGTTDALCCRS